jgi:2-keto-4-pentenoate hydratase
MAALPPTAVAQAAEILAAARRDPAAYIEPLPRNCRPNSASDAYSVQYRLHECLLPDYGPLVGYKIGCTTPVMQSHLSIGEPCAGTLRASTVVQGPAELRFADFHAPGVECELAVRMGSDLPKRERPYGQEDAAAAVDAVMAAIEVVDNRYRDLWNMGIWSLVADDFVNAGAVLGPPVALERLGDLGTVVGSLSVDGREVGRGHGRDVLGHPLAALAWLTNTLPDHGRTLKRGDVVLLGSVVQVAWLDGPGRISAAFDRLGAADATFV